MRETIRSLVIRAAAIWSKAKPGVYIMNGHYLSRQCNKDVDVFIQLLDEMARYSRFVSIQQATHLVLSGDAKDVKETLVAFTFDDGFDDCYHALAPALEKHQVNACFFVNPGFVDGDAQYHKRFTEEVVLTPGKKPMSWQQITSLHQRGFVIGNHTFDHLRLSDIELSRATQQVVTSKQVIEDKLGEQCDYFAWPFGQYADVNQEVINLLLDVHSYVYSGCDFQNYTSFDGRVLNRRHFEADWPAHEVEYFLSKPRFYSQ